MYGKGRHVTGPERAELTALLVRWYRGGASVRQLAERTGRSYQTIRNMLTEAGIPLRPRGGHRYPPPDSASPLHPNATYAHALGAELQRLRHAKNWTRARMCRDLDISVQTLATYENGTRAISSTRLAELSAVLGTQPHAVLAMVDRAILANPNRLAVDLADLARTTDPALAPARRWASVRLAAQVSGKPPLVVLGTTALHHLATLCHMDPRHLANNLRFLPPATTSPADQ